MEKVSIHAPARGATRNAPPALLPENVSIHAPARGATQPIGTTEIIVMFQSTPPRGGRHTADNPLNSKTKCIHFREGPFKPTARYEVVKDRDLENDINRGVPPVANIPGKSRSLGVRGDLQTISGPS